MPEPSEKDMEEARDVVLTPRIERLPCGHFGDYAAIIRSVALAIASAREEGRREGLEGAQAKLGAMIGMEPWAVRRATLVTCRDAIRELRGGSNG